jgi:flagellar basal-body rod protein FlgC
MREFFRIFAVSGSALTAQRWRLNVISSNLANAETTRTSQGGPYRRKDVLFVPWRGSFQEILGREIGQNQEAVKVQAIVEDPRPFKTVYNPGHPDADPSGYVLLPNVNPMEEMVNLIAAARSYEANLEVFNAAKAMLLKALEIGRI